MSTEVLVKTLEGEQKFMDFNEFTRVLVIEPNQMAKVYEARLSRARSENGFSESRTEMG
jgi:hypothetical protein